jgi:hypothetical protein
MDCGSRPMRLAHTSMPLRLANCGAGSPPRRAGNFWRSLWLSLLRQRKVTKREALNRTPEPHTPAAQHNNPSASGKTRPAALSLLSLSPASVIAPLARLTRGCTPGSREMRIRRRSGDAVFPGKPGVQPALTGVKQRWVVLVTGTAARAQRVASARSAAGRFHAPLLAVSRSHAVQGLFFGDFLLAPQKKVTPPPGGTPGTALATRQASQ